MGLLIHSPFLHALGYSIISSLWQFAVLWLLYVSVNTVCKLSSHQKYCVGLFFQFLGFGWFLISLIFYYTQYTEIEGSLSLLQAGQYDKLYSIGDDTFRNKFLNWLILSEGFLPYLSVAYLTITLFLSLKWLQSYKWAQSLRTNGLQKMDVQWRLFVQQLSYQLGIKRTVSIYVSQIVKTPLTIGYFKPIILIPFATLNYLSAEQMEAVIIHELAHIKRFDYLFNLFLALIEASLFFNPFMQLISRHIKRERENCCDDWVLQYEYNAASYAMALLHIANYQAHNTAVAMKAIGDKQVLLGRIKRIIEKNEKTFFYYRHQLFALLVMTIVFSTLAFLSPGSNKLASVIVKPSTQAITVQPLAASVDNPLFNPIFFLANEGKPQTPSISKAGLTSRNKVITAVSTVPVPSGVKIVMEAGRLQPASNQVHLINVTPPIILENKLRVEKIVVNQDTAGFNVPLATKAAVKRLVIKDPVTRVFTRIETGLEKQKKELDKLKELKDIKIALEKIRIAKKQLELVAFRNIEKTDVLSSTSMSLNLDHLLNLDKRELQLAEQKLKEHLDELLAQLEVKSSIYTTVSFTENREENKNTTLEAMSEEDKEVSQYYKPSDKKPTRVRVTKKGKVIYIIKI